MAISTILQCDILQIGNFVLLLRSFRDGVAALAATSISKIGLVP